MRAKIILFDREWKPTSRTVEAGTMLRRRYANNGFWVVLDVAEQTMHLLNLESGNDLKLPWRYVVEVFIHFEDS